MKTRNNFLLLIITSLIIFCSLTSYLQPKKFFSVKEKEIIDRDGNPILLKGINLGNWLVPEGYMFHFSKINSPQFIYLFFNTLVGPEEANKFWEDFRRNYITRDDIRLIKSLGFNSVRIPFNYRLFITDYPFYELKGVGYALLDSAINWCKQESLYVILDMHCAPGGQTGDNIDDSFGYPFLFDSPLAQEHTAKIWKRLAEIYKDEEIIIGYDLLNEPIAHYFDVDRLKPLLEPLYKRITSAIREVDNNHLIFLGGAIWDSDFSIFNKPFDEKLVYTFHKYWTAPTEDVIKSYIDFRDKYNVPIWMGESGENTNEWIKDFRIVLEKHNIGWCFWPYKKLESERGVVSIKQPKDYELIKNFAESFDLSYKYIRENRPDINKVREILKNFLENCKVQNCKLNEGYVKALGLQ